MADYPLAAPRVALLADDYGLDDRRGPIPDVALAIALTATVLYPKVVSLLLSVLSSFFHSSLPPLVGVLLLVWMNGVSESERRPGRARMTIGFGLAYAALILAVDRFVAVDYGKTPSTTFEQVALLLPLSAACGWVLVRSGRIVQYFSWLLVVGTATVPLAAYEHYAGVAVIGGAPKFVENGFTRAVVAADHPLVLATLFVALMPIAMWLGGRWGFVISSWLYFGVFMTGSNGPKIVGGLILVICLVPPIARMLLSSWWPLTVFLASIALAIFVGATLFWSTQITSTNSNDVSNAYRQALYYLLPHLLQRRPFGYGVGGLPNNTWYVSTAGSGLRDVSRSIDSELVYAAAQFGVIAVITFILIAIVGVCAAVRHHAIGLSSLSVTLVGLFLSIHSWNSLGTFWMLGFGASLALVNAGDDLNSWRGLFRRRAEVAHVRGSRAQRRRDPPSAPMMRQDR